jgi:PAS domain S-box-containing protein
VLDCNAAFCRLFGANKERWHGRSINSLVPVHMRSQHNEAIHKAVDEISGTFTRKEKFVLGLHVSGYLLPLQISVRRQADFGSISKFVARFHVASYHTPTLFFLTDGDGLIQGATSGMTSPLTFCQRCTPGSVSA